MVNGVLDIKKNSVREGFKKNHWICDHDHRFNGFLSLTYIVPLNFDQFLINKKNIMNESYGNAVLTVTSKILLYNNSMNE